MNVRDDARWLVASVLLVSSCEADSTVWWEGQYVRYTASEGLQECAGTPALLDEFVPFVAGELGIPTPLKLEYRWMTPEDYAPIGCSEESLGCAVGSHSYSMQPMHVHELVHPVTGASDMNGLAFFAEGLATTYDPFSVYPYPRNIAEATNADPRPQMLLSADDLEYSTAAAFVSFLLTRHGPQKLVAISRRSRFDDDLNTLRTSFHEVYGIELDDEVEFYMDRGEMPCENEHFAVRPQDCTMPEVPWSGDRWVYAGVMDCADVDVAGAMDWYATRSVTLDIPTAGQFAVHAFGDGRARVLLGRCFGCSWQHQDIALDLDTRTDRVTLLEPGTYFVRIVADAEELAPMVGVTVTPVPAL